eukprot:scaffold68_cov340-Pavlova_lutheri.AAC.31
MAQCKVEQMHITSQPMGIGHCPVTMIRIWMCSPKTALPEPCFLSKSNRNASQFYFYSYPQDSTLSIPCNRYYKSALA